MRSLASAVRAGTTRAQRWHCREWSARRVPHCGSCCAAPRLRFLGLPFFSRTRNAVSLQLWRRAACM
eukprot:4789021-Alexandrium_andersonii.AAC.1